MSRTNSNVVGVVVVVAAVVTLLSANLAVSAPQGLEDTVNGLTSSLTSGLTNGLFGGLRNSLSGGQAQMHNGFHEQAGQHPMANYMNQFRAFARTNDQFPQMGSQLWPQQMQGMMNGQSGANGFPMGQFGQMSPYSPGQGMNGFPGFQQGFGAQTRGPFNPNSYNNPMGGMFG